MNFFEQELRKMFGQGGAQFVGRSCYMNLDSAVRAKIEFITHGTHEKYEGIKATVINRKDGVIDSATVLFEDLLGMKQTRNMPVAPHIWQYGGKYEWYAYKPNATDYRMIAGEVSDYLDVFREQTLEQSRSGSEPERAMEQQMM